MKRRRRQSRKGRRAAEGDISFDEHVRGRPPEKSIPLRGARKRRPLSLSLSLSRTVERRPKKRGREGKKTHPLSKNGAPLPIVYNMQGWRATIHPLHRPPPVVRASFDGGNHLPAREEGGGGARAKGKKTPPSSARGGPLTNAERSCTPSEGWPEGGIGIRGARPPPLIMLEALASYRSDASLSGLDDKVFGPRGGAEGFFEGAGPLAPRPRPPHFFPLVLGAVRA